MDTLAHSLAGAALGYAGLKDKTGFGLLTLVVAANLPDLDAVSLLFGESFTWWRGWTHGPVAILLLPPLLAALMLGLDRWQSRRGSRPKSRPQVRFKPLLLLAYIGAISHPLLDLLNSYGIRLLMPFSELQFYGDTLFIADIWLWVGLGMGVWASHRRYRRGSTNVYRPARTSLIAACAYIGLMGVGSVHAERTAERVAEERGFGPIDEVIANPVLANPFRRQMVLRIGDNYRFGDFRWTPVPQLELDPRLLTSNMNDSAVAAAARTDDSMADFLYWSVCPLRQLSVNRAR